ncbi:hypothetical protein [Streptomyces albireticuli]|uniref:Uncharacterized protein n=1 Tax=Streptomyces albireticuli TaxID=1940 RepID=A0A2A2D9C5_9ACTN|nr:hypothetical protein [Streptomyces albireticuli]MCD9145909.1 hypothetical protein [Streptomyces albireticuli]MCD9166079.1 hypothetical protein [Streptomyces albireticuli]MCD9196359.1 hypothetical protein [Streptomyces albireticuli]PAU47979.1 hypothetical protein CK936_15835 [Streptomyces albireticuli]
MNWTPTTLVHIDEATDLDRASDGRSRYGVYLRQQDPKAWFMDEEEARDPGVFVRFAWTAGTGPIMSPAYAVVRPDLDIRLTRAEEDGSLLVLIDVRLHHDSLAKEHRPPYRVASWETVSVSDSGDYPARIEPQNESRTALLVTVTLRISGATWDLWQPSGELDGEALTDDAKQAVRRLAELINTNAGPKVAALLGSESGRW